VDGPIDRALTCPVCGFDGTIHPAAGPWHTGEPPDYMFGKLLLVEIRQWCFHRKHLYTAIVWGPAYKSETPIIRWAEIYEEDTP
jgi:hypothetical protein